ncbi:xylan 1,4-beta-xylosidase [Salipaludibacillus agaradhaerens]|uniref:GH39 family glycosyl hydrolase n=1 Tax=Salipaludibacillus agaradhaerens TaxID=76935 RepID=UPI002151A5B1|nr:xylan 1,4-beta-xylosidase [Salipaludibacillus agaradhaerens]MCR6108005.1 xylan 1,4-beta-xylosidase [Salipaludibacillus agaradhaerens]MCR6120032.1 xylan 1,4-beta-xylosidase [Salipaludibacillus agaradhaerens]
MEKIIVSRENDIPFNKHWKKCIGTGRLGLALQKEYVDHLERLQQDIAFDYIRGHGLFHEDIGIYKEIDVDGTLTPFYNFTYIDRIFDTFLQNNLRPFVELGFMPKKLASGSQTIFYWEGNVTPPADEKKWEELIYHTVAHFVERYGIEEVLQWPFEVWNEPNLTNFWENADKQAYFQLYKITAKTIKSIHPDLNVGGPAICGGTDEWITDFLHFCHKEQVPVDFISRHAYTSMPPKKKTPDYYYQDLADPNDMLTQLTSVKKLIHDTPYPELPFHITEYNTSYSPINPIHDTNYNAAYLGKILSHAGDIVSSFSYWTFSDVFEEFDIPRAPFHGGFGLMALHAIRKPTYHLFSFFNKLGDTCLYKDDTMIVTKHRDNTISIVAWNLIHDKGDNHDKTITLSIPFSSDDVFLYREITNEHHANPWRVWQQMGRPRFPSKDQITILKSCDAPFIQTNRLRTENKLLTFQLTMAKNEVTLLHFSDIIDETNTYIGLDDSLLTSY